MKTALRSNKHSVGDPCRSEFERFCNISGSESWCNCGDLQMHSKHMNVMLYEALGDLHSASSIKSCWLPVGFPVSTGAQE